MNQNKQRILIVAEDPSVGERIKKLLGQGRKDLIVYAVESSLQAIDSIYGDPPDLIMIDNSLEEGGGRVLCNRVKTDQVFGHLPIILMVDIEGGLSLLDWESTYIDDYVHIPIDVEELISRVSLTFARTRRVWDANPLTRLPGNHSIMKEMQRRIDGGLCFAVGYADLDNFKPFNDKYGFYRGDEVIKMTARLLTNTIRELDSADAFVGHIGGDDFVFIVPPDSLDGVCREIIRNFDMIIGNFYDEEDRVRGYIGSKNRKGEEERFSILSISIGVVTNERRDIRHIGEISTIATEMKAYAKTVKGSNYFKDQRAESGKVYG